MEGVIALFFEQRVTLLEQDIIGIQAVEILFVVLRDDYIEKASTLVAAVFYQSPVLRTDHHQRQEPETTYIPVESLTITNGSNPIWSIIRL